MLSFGTIHLSALAERMGQEKMGGCHPESYSTWWLLQLAVEKPWSALGGPFFSFPAQKDLHFWHVGSFQSRVLFSGWRALKTERSLMSVIKVMSS